jgi:hypothetical protein
MHVRVHTVSIDIGGLRATGEVLSIQRLPEGRMLLQIRCSEAIDRGRTCVLQGPTGQNLECVVSNFTRMGDVFVFEMRCLEDASFLSPEPPGGE